MTRARWGRPRRSALVVTVVLHLKAVVLQGIFLGLVVVPESTLGPGILLSVPPVTFLLAELALVVDEIFFFGVFVEAVPPDRGPTTVRPDLGPPPEQGQVAPVPAHVNLVFGDREAAMML